MTNDLLRRAEEGDLYAVLALSTKEELDPLVDVITSRAWNFLNVSDEYKRHSPDHTKYHSLIGDELRLYGGNTLWNIGRRGEGPPYEKLVADVCWKLSIPYEKGRVVENEGNLLDIFLEQRWQALDPSERERLAANARQSALGQTSEKGWYLKAGASTLMIPIFATGGWAVLGISMLDASYKVTVPCVLHVAYLRRKFIGEGRGAAKSAVTRSDPRPKDKSALEFHDIDGGSMLSFSEVREPSLQAWRPIDRKDTEISRLNSIVQVVPAIGTAAEVAGATGTKYMEIVCNGDLMKAAKGGGYRAMSRGANGIKEHANLFGPDKLANLANASALMNVASVALAQKHLADISEKLSELKNDVGRVASFQKTKRRSVLTGAIHYFEQKAPAVMAGEHSASVLGQIERHEADLLQVQHHLTEDLNTALRDLKDTKDDGWFTSNKFVVLIEERQRELHDLLQQLMLCLRTRALGWQLLCQFPDGELGKQHRKDDILRSLAELHDCGAQLSEVDAALRSKLKGASSLWAAENMNRRKLTLLRGGEEALMMLSAEQSRILLGIEQVDAMQNALQEPFRLMVKVEEGEITAVQGFGRPEGSTTPEAVRASN